MFFLLLVSAWASNSSDLPLSSYSFDQEKHSKAVQTIQRFYKPWKTRQKYQEILSSEKDQKFFTTLLENLREGRNDYWPIYPLIRFATYQNQEEEELNIQVKMANGGYQRMHPSPFFLSELLKITPPNRQLLNSRYALDKIKNFIHEKRFTEFLEKGGNFYAVQDPIIKLKFESLDLKVSSYQILKNLYRKPTSNERLTALDNKGIKLFFDSFDLKALYKRQSLHLLYEMLFKTVRGLKETPFHCDGDFSRKLLKIMGDLLRFLNGVVDVGVLQPCLGQSPYKNKISSWTIESYERLHLLYQLFHDFLFTFLAYQAPYRYSDFQQVASQNFSFYYHSLLPKEKFDKVYLASSGMDALTKALMSLTHYPGKPKFKPLLMEIASSAANQSTYLEECPLYYEVTNIVLESLFESPLPVIMTGPTSSRFSRDDDSLLKIRTEVMRAIVDHGKAVLILDTTLNDLKIFPTTGVVDQKDDPLCCLLSNLKIHINDGSLSVFLCKSLQKFPSLGAAKAKAGMINLITYDPDFKKVEQYLEAMSKDLFTNQNDEYQSIIHYLKFNQDSEIKFIQQAKRNGQNFLGFLKAECKGRLEKKKTGQTEIKNFINSFRQEGPFLFYQTLNSFFPLEEGKSNSSLPDKLEILKSLTFGYPFTTQCDSFCPQIQRVSVGLEPTKILRKMAEKIVCDFMS